MVLTRWEGCCRLTVIMVFMGGFLFGGSVGYAGCALDAVEFLANVRGDFFKFFLGVDRAIEDDLAVRRGHGEPAVAVDREKRDAGAVVDQGVRRGGILNLA